MADRPVVLFIAGSGRSGSTLLERMLGGIDGYTNVGELIDLFRRVYEGNERCGCGEHFLDCEFWREVGDRAFGGWTRELVRHVVDLQLQVARQRHMPRHMIAMGGKAFQRAAAEYRAHYVSLYKAIKTTSQARVVVDASKWPAQALALAGDELDLRIIHLRRDIRGVTWSLSKRNVTRPQATSGKQVMASSGLLTSAGRWAICQTEVNLLRSAKVPRTLVQYEDLVRQARGEVMRALSDLGLNVATEEVEHLGVTEVRLEASHGLSGNPSRFVAGRTSLRVDETWRHSMTPLQRAAVATIGIPHRHRSTRTSSAKQLRP